MNLPKVNWADLVSTDPTEQLFLNTFGNLSLEQLVDVPTHIKGNILDYLITDSDNAHCTVHTLLTITLLIIETQYAIKFNLSL